MLHLHLIDFLKENSRIEHIKYWTANAKTGSRKEEKIRDHCLPHKIVLL